MSKVTIRPGTVEDAVSLGPRLREEDAMELTLTSAGTPTDILKESLEFSDECFSAVVDGVVIAMGGFALEPKTSMGIPWLVGSPEIERHPVTLVAAGRSAVDRWEKQCTVMANVTHQDNVVHHRWLKAIGFTFLDAVVPLGPSKAPFLQFYRYS